MSLRNISFIQVFEQFDTFTQFNVLTELMKKMDVKEVDLIGKFQKKIRDVAGIEWKFSEGYDKPQYFQPSFDSPSLKDWRDVIAATHITGYIVIIRACFINDEQKLGVKTKNGKKIINDGFVANVYDGSGDLGFDVKGQEEIVKLFKMESQELND